MSLGTLRELAGSVGGRVVGDDTVAVARIAAVEEAAADTLTFATDERYFAAAMSSRAAAVLVDASVALPEQPAKALIVVENARHALAKLLQRLRAPRPHGPFRHPTAVVEDDADVAPDAYLGAHAYVGHRARVGSGAALGAGAYVGDDASIGAAAWLHPGARVMHGCVAGDRVVLHAGCVIGSEGFGWAFIDGRLERIPQIGNVVLGDDVEIGANTCIDRAQTGSTTVGTGTKIDNLVQIGHNCHIGKHCAFAALTGLAGSTVVGDYVKIAGQVGTRGHMTIGSRATVAGQSGVWGDVAEGAMVSGNPARDHREDLRREVMVRKLPKLIARVDALERANAREDE
ncbi:MAG: UDP-3-O-(3-hydroxymyristoyl)glucosamine N-acyltransferase [Candidatus Eremiobacteraeota bacterium]|nr:UDP-3-O-(3-hydroxymyristoyl)glucosamine N-acyltransferase [Candidatus Eremiobacteraeota bacterium]